MQEHSNRTTIYQDLFFALPIFFRRLTFCKRTYDVRSSASYVLSRVSLYEICGSDDFIEKVGTTAQRGNRFETRDKIATVYKIEKRPSVGIFHQDSCS